MTDRASENTHDSFLDFYRSTYGHTIREARTAGRTGAAFMLLQQDAGDWSDAPVPDLVIAQVLHHAVTTTFDLGAGRFHTPAMRHGEAICIAPGTGTTVLVEGPHVIRTMAVPYAALCSLAGDDAGLPADGDLGILHADILRDRDLRSSVDRLWMEAQRGDIHGSLLVDGTLLHLVACLLRLRDGRLQVARGGLASWQLKRVTEYLAANIGQGVSLAELAGVVGLSPAHFSRAYKQATGRSPVQALIDLRMERARSLLANPHIPVIEVAAMCGYDSPSAFAQVFRRHTGVTPSEWRRRL